MTHYLDKRYFGYRKRCYMYAPNEGELKIVSPAGTVTFAGNKITIDGTSVFEDSVTLSGGATLNQTLTFGSDYGVNIPIDVAGMATSGDPGTLFKDTPMSSATGYFLVTINGVDGLVPIYSADELF